MTIKGTLRGIINIVLFSIAVGFWTHYIISDELSSLILSMAISFTVSFGIKLIYDIVFAVGQSKKRDACLKLFYRQLMFFEMYLSEFISSHDNIDTSDIYGERLKVEDLIRKSVIYLGKENLFDCSAYLYDSFIDLRLNKTQLLLHDILDVDGYKLFKGFTQYVDNYKKNYEKYVNNLWSDRNKLESMTDIETHEINEIIVGAFNIFVESTKNVKYLRKKYRKKHKQE